MKKYADIDEYIESCSGDTRTKLEAVRATIRKAVPQAQEAISYGMPAFRLHGKHLVYFAAFAHHIGFYATPQGHVEFEPELSKYKRGKGSVQFPLDEPLPLDLIRRISIFRAKQITKGV